MITLCVPTLSQYENLNKCIESAFSGNIPVDKVLIIDNGGRYYHNDPRVTILKQSFNLGVAASWNLLVNKSEEHRIISNDDVIFMSDTIQKMVEALEQGNEFVWAIRGINGFSCFAIKNSLYETVGPFDEEISPRYAYFEDNDYHYRMKLEGKDAFDSGAEAIHIGSATLKAMDSEQTQQHRIKFETAQQNYIKKWGGVPGKEAFTTPFNQ
jgi:GT2 family glycosyltransferase